MSLAPHWMRESEEGDVRLLYQLAHPTWPIRPPHFFQAFPTLVISTSNRLLGYTQFNLTMHEEFNLMSYGVDLAVAPDARGAGLGTQLHTERMRIARSLGAGCFTGLTSPDNAPMIRLFERAGMKPVRTIDPAFADRSPGVAWFTTLKEN